MSWNSVQVKDRDRNRAGGRVSDGDLDWGRAWAWQKANRSAQKLSQGHRQGQEKELRLELRKWLGWGFEADARARIEAEGTSNSPRFSMDPGQNGTRTTVGGKKKIFTEESRTDEKTSHLYANEKRISPGGSLIVFTWQGSHHESCPRSQSSFLCSQTER